MAEGTFVKGITEKAEAEDGEGKSVTGSERVAIEETGECLVVIFLAGDDAGTAQFYSNIREYITMGSHANTHFQNVGLNAIARAETTSW